VEGFDPSSELSDIHLHCEEEASSIRYSQRVERADGCLVGIIGR
jgi:hypothetical protein